MLESGTGASGQRNSSLPTPSTASSSGTLSLRFFGREHRLDGVVVDLREQAEGFGQRLETPRQPADARVAGAGLAELTVDDNSLLPVRASSRGRPRTARDRPGDGRAGNNRTRGSPRLRK
jgi:hypothetical protein